MPFSLLSTKLYIPPLRANAITRPRLTGMLLSCMSQPDSFTLLSGPAGSGKTTLLSEFADRLKASLAWISLDEGDNDPVRFWSYLIAACETVQEGVGESALALLRAPQHLPDEMIPTILINDLARLRACSQASDLALVLDDYHAIQNRIIHAALLFLLEHLPGNLHVVISTRVDPPWPLARFRARSQLVEIRAQDLRFTTEEAASYLNQVMGLNLTAEEVAALEERTEGWAAGLQLAALSMKGRSDAAAFVKSFTGSHVYIAEYLVEEVLQRQPEEIQRFLLQTSILDKLCGPLCDRMIERRETRDEKSPPLSALQSRFSSSQAILEYLNHSNLFLISLDGEGRWFRYHHLFADLLRAHLRQALPVFEFAGLHRRAAGWYEQNGFTVEAVNHLLAAGDFEEAARLVEQNTFPLMTQGELATLLRWIDALPPDLTRRRPSFLLAKAWALTFAGVSGQIELLLQQVEAQIEREGETPAGREILGNVTALRAFFTLMAGNDERALELAERAETLLPTRNIRASWSSPYTLAAHSVLPYTLGMAYRNRGQYEKAAEAFTGEVQLYPASEAVLVWVIATIELAVTRRLQGRLRESGEICYQALQRMAGQGALPFGPFARLDAILADILREQNALDEAYQRVSGAIERVQSWVMPADRLTFYLTMMRVQEAQGDLAGAHETLRLAKKLKTAHPVFLDLARMVDLYEVRLALATDATVTAGRLMNDLRPGASRSVFLRDQELILLARLRLAEGKPDEAVAICSPLAGEAEQAGRLYAWLETIAVQACAMDACAHDVNTPQAFESREAAVNLLIKALAFAMPEGFVRVFMDQGEAMRLLIADCRLVIEKLGQEQLLHYIDTLLDVIGREPASRKPPAFCGQKSSERSSHVISDQKSSIGNLIEPLTSREMEVLQLIAAGDSNRTIAGKLVITVRAVKKHTGNIYTKLNVQSRTQAVARALQLGLLATD